MSRTKLIELRRRREIDERKAAERHDRFIIDMVNGWLAQRATYMQVRGELQIRIDELDDRIVDVVAEWAR
jgi:hypothetical protein